MATLTAAQKNELVSIYVGYFNRAPDPDGMQFYINKLEAEPAETTLALLANNFANSPEAKGLYPYLVTPALSSASAFIESIYQNLFNRPADAEGKAYWLDKLTTGVRQPGEMIIAIIKGAVAGDDKAIIDNKIAVGLDFVTDAANKSGFVFDDAAKAAAKAALAGVDATAASVTAAQAATDAFLSSSVGLTNLLTVNTDTVIGTDGDDTISAQLVASGGVAGQATLNPLDNIDGGAGVDTLLLENPGVLTGTIKNVENAIFLGPNVGGVGVNGDAAVNATAFSGTVGLQQTNDTSVTITNVAGQTISTDRVADSTVVDVDSTATATTLALRSTGAVGDTVVTADGAALTSVSLSVDGTATGKSFAIDNADVDTDGAGPDTDTVTNDNTVKNVSIDAAGKSTVTFEGTALEAVTITGKGATTFSSTKAASKSIDASGSEGGATITPAMANGALFTGGAGKDTITVGVTTKAITMGAGDDTVNVAGALGVGGSLDGGDGTADTLAMASATAAALSATTPFEATVSNFEVLKISAVAGGTDVVNLANLDDISLVKSGGTAAGTGTAEIQTITVTGAGDANGGHITVGGVDIVVPPLATSAQIAAAIQAQSGAIIAANPLIASVATAGSVVTVTYQQQAADQVDITVSDHGSGATFGLVATVAPGGTNESLEQQTITVGTAPIATGNFTVGGVTVNAVLGDTTAQVAAKIQAALDANKPIGVGTVTVATNVVTVTFTTAAADAAALVVTANAGIFGGVPDPAVLNDAVGFTPAVAEAQTFAVTGGTDANGGSIVVNGAVIELGPNLTVDQVGAAIAAASAQIITADPTVATVGYNTLTDTVTVTYQASAGNVAPDATTVADNTASGGTYAIATATPGVAGLAAGSLSLTNMATGGTLELNGALNGAASVAVKDAATTPADVLNVKLNGAANLINPGVLTVASVETINVEATDSTTTADPTAASTLNLNATSATTVNVTGNHGVNFTGSTLTALTALDASGVTGKAAAGSVTFASSTTNKDISLKGGAGNDFLDGRSTTDATKVVTIDGGAGNDTITGAAGKDVLVGGEGKDIITGGAAADALTGGAGNDTFVLAVAADSVLAARDVINDFSANTFGNGAAGVAGTGAVTVSAANFTGDVIDVTAFTVVGVNVTVQANAADAQTYIQNQTGGANLLGAALDSSTGLLYMDLTNDGVIDSVIELTGVTTIDAAAFLIA
jgi:hypothetical protein